MDFHQEFYVRSKEQTYQLVSKCDNLADVFFVRITSGKEFYAAMCHKHVAVSNQSLLFAGDTVYKKIRRIDYLIGSIMET